MAAETLRGEIAVTRAMTSAGRAVQRAWRDQVRGAGLGARLANSVRQRVYPAGEPSMKAAALIWTKAPKIIGAFDRGALIRSSNGFWLAIPTAAAGRGGRGRITPGQWENRTGRRLRFVYRKGRSALLVDDGNRRIEGGSLRRGQFGPRAPRAFRNRTVPIFVLVRQVRLPKKLSLDAATARGAAGISGLIVAGWRDEG
ncbi:MAG: DUF6441 family protein [Rhodobacteraceae bacterium]|nr:DUF6441 family protein [Paracoccaceae bacterium]